MIMHENKTCRQKINCRIKLSSYRLRRDNDESMRYQNKEYSQIQAILY